MYSMSMSELLNSVKLDAIAKFNPNKNVEPLFEAITTVVHMSNVARKEGLLALEETFVANVMPENADASSLALLIVDGTDPDIVAEVATNEYWIGKYEGNEALRQYILMRGALMVQCGENPRIIEHMLKSLLPKSIREACTKHIDAKKTVWAAEDEAKVIERFKKWKPFVLTTNDAKTIVSEVEDLVLSLDDRALQRAMRDIENYDLVACMSVFSDKARHFIFKNMSRRLQLMIMKELLSASWYLKDDSIILSAEKIKNIIERLEVMGEIVIIH